MPVAQPHQELRFTRAGQATGFWIAAAATAGAVVTLLVASLCRGENPQLPHPAWALVPLAASFLCARVALRCTRHAYLILTPLGVEIFPFWRPAADMRVIPWAQIASAEIDSSRLTLHFTAEKTAGVHLSLRPIPPARRELLFAALQGRIASS